MFVSPPCGSLPVAGEDALTHEALWLMKRVGAPAPSPDGQWVVFPVTEPAYDEKEQVADLWIVARRRQRHAPAPHLRARPPRRSRLEPGQPPHLRSPRNAKATKRRRSTCWTWPAAARRSRVTSLSTGARKPKWRPDGNALLFTSVVLPRRRGARKHKKKIATERKAQKYKVRAYDGFPVRYWDKWLDDTQAHVFVQASGARGTGRRIFWPGRSSRPSGLRRPHDRHRRGAGHRVGAGRRLASCSPRPPNRNKAAYAEVPCTSTRSRPPAASREALTTGPGTYARPAFSPDGSALFALHAPRTAGSTTSRGWREFPWPNPGKPAAPDRTASTARCRASRSRPDSADHYFTAEDAGIEKLYSVAIGGGARCGRQSTKLGCYADLAIPRRTRRRPGGELGKRGEPGGGRPHRSGRGAPPALTDFNIAKAAQIDWAPLRHFWFTSRAGKKIHNMVALPPAFDETKKYPLLRADPRRAARRCGATSRSPLELPPARGARLRRAADRLHGLDRLRREVRAGHQARPPRAAPDGD